MGKAQWVECPLIAVLNPVNSILEFPAGGRKKPKNQEFIVILNYIVSLRIAWAT